jgi:hypothetical protein
MAGDRFLNNDKDKTGTIPAIVSNDPWLPDITREK